MPQQQSPSNSFSGSHPSTGRRPTRWWLSSSLLLACAILVGILSSPLAGAAANDDGLRVSGAGKTIVEGGTGGTTPEPVTTLLAFHANAKGGNFECLALAPPQATDREAVSLVLMQCM
jgi:hypothetical protein